MKIDVLCNDGSPLGVSLKTLMGEDVQQIGCGGAELVLLTLCEAWTRAGVQVRLYNNPREPNVPPFEQLPITAFNPQEDRDVLIIFRSPNTRMMGAKGMKVWYSHDQSTIGDFKAFSQLVDKIVTVSTYHSEYFAKRYGILNTISIDNPVRTWEFTGKVEKVKHRCVFCSVPDRGLQELINLWPRILERVPDASLVVTSDYRLWGTGNAGNAGFISLMMGLKNLEMLGAVKRPRMVEEQMKAEVLTYPCKYDENFCIVVSESLVAGVYPVTSNYGALGTTNELGKVIPGNVADSSWAAQFVNEVEKALTDPEIIAARESRRLKAIERFNVGRILNEWQTKVFA